MILAIYWPEIIMKNYTGFIQSEHLKIDTNIELFGNHKNTLGTKWAQWNNQGK